MTDEEIVLIDITTEYQCNHDGTHNVRVTVGNVPADKCEWVALALTAMVKIALVRVGTVVGERDLNERTQ